MSYFADESPYQFEWNEKRDTPLNVGWLSRDAPFPVQALPTAIIDQIWHFCHWPAAATRGWHSCELCNQAGRSTFGPINVIYRKTTLELGTAEIHVFSEGPKVYCAPDLIFHYVTRHQYRPPDGFVQALIHGPRPPSPGYTRRIINSNRYYLEYGAPEPLTRRSIRRFCG